MERQRQIKILSIVALVVAIVGMSLGFAAFSTTLNISSSASVTPSSDNFKVVLCNSSDVENCNLDIIWFVNDCTLNNGASVDGTATLNGTFASGFDVIFTKPGQSVVYTFYAHNVGEYDAYLNGVTYTALDNGSYKKCSANTKDGSNATDSLVQTACNGIKATISVDGVEYNLGDESISGHKLSKNTSEEIVFKIEYVDGSAYVDGSFDVQLSDFKLVYSTVDNSSFITFKISGTSYQAEEGMTWKEWVNSDYNTGNYYINGSLITVGDGNYIMTDYLDAINLSSVITDSTAYIYGNHPV